MDHKLDLSALNIDDIVEEYKILFDRHEQLKLKTEDDAQKIHQLKRSLDTALAAEAYLTHELEQVSAQSQNATSAESPRAKQKIDDMQRKYNDLQKEHETLQLDYDAKVEETVALRGKLEAAERDMAANAALKVNHVLDNATRLHVLEEENAELMQKLEKFQEATVQHTLAVAEKERTIEILRDQASCLEENLACKRNELEEKLQMLESAQEQLIEANAKIAMLSTAPEESARKGNSLFAEVDDQRQVMKQMLADQKKSYLQMKKVFNESQYEIHRLKRENIAMHTELQACSTIFCSADRTLQNKLRERIRHLLSENDMLERKLNVTQERLRELANEKSVIWLDSMLDFCKRETDELKTQLRSTRIQNAGLEEEVRKTQQNMVRWRFESLRSRCVVIDRENLLTEHKISFKPMQAMEFNIKEAELETALPRIMNADSAKNEALPGESTMNSPATNAPNVIAEPQKSPEAAKPNKKGTPVKVRQAPELCALPAKHTPCKTEPAQISEVIKDLDTPQAKGDESGTPICSLIRVKDEKELQSMPHQQTVSKTEAIPDGIKEEIVSEPDVSSIMAAKPNRKGTPIKLSDFKASIEDSTDSDASSPTPPKPQRKGTPVKAKKDKNTDDIEPAKPQRKGTPVKALFSASSNSNVRSILQSKQRDLFDEEPKKNVKFSNKEPTVHNISPIVPLPDKEVTELSKENQKPIAMKPKSKGIIRHIVVGARKPNPGSLK
ncbi:protein Spindly [Scaptodrosophila lebanonensis]|uniref:Protein Spindly n=1 Tax=Drosophila lebanonensis TaxID=7225 RepID=A0A6J2U858_DROLE|nr:protein Spindly [Scaptodrosophila lebanonensis]